jgi:hypothetical protein
MKKNKVSRLIQLSFLKTSDAIACIHLLKSININDNYSMTYELEGFSRSATVDCSGKQLLESLEKTLRRWPTLSLEELNSHLGLVVIIWATRSISPQRFAAEKSTYRPDALKVVERSDSQSSRSERLLSEILQSYICLKMSKRSEQDIASRRNAVRIVERFPTIEELDFVSRNWDKLGQAFSVKDFAEFKSRALRDRMFCIGFHEISGAIGRGHPST